MEWPSEIKLTVFRGSSKDAFVGFGESDGGTWMIQGSPGNAEAKRINQSDIPQHIAQCIRRGYTRSQRAMYYNPREQDLTYIHPDLCGGRDEWVVACVGQEIESSAQAVAQKALSAGVTVIYPEEVDLWLKRQRQNYKYLVAFSDMPIWSLAVIQTAHERGWMLRSSPNMPPMPDEPIADAFERWDEWLKSAFPIAKVVEARQCLGLHKLKSIDVALPLVSSDPDDLVGIF